MMSSRIYSLHPTRPCPPSPISPANPARRPSTIQAAAQVPYSCGSTGAGERRRVGGGLSSQQWGYIIHICPQPPHRPHLPPCTPSATSQAFRTPMSPLATTSRLLQITVRFGHLVPPRRDLACVDDDGRGYALGLSVVCPGKGEKYRYSISCCKRW